MKGIIMAAGRSRSEPPVLLTSREVARLLHIGVKSVFKLVQAGVVPPPIRLSRKILRWRAEDIARFLRGGGGKSA